MAITASRTTLGMDREVARESASSNGRASLMRKGLRQAKKEKNYEKALQFAAGLEGEGKAYGMTGSAADTASLAQGRVASREALANQMRSQTPALTGQTREAKISAAKSAGTFESTRQKYNADAKSSGKTMDEAGNITDLPKETPPATGTTPPATGTTPPATGGTSKPAAGAPPPATGTTPPAAGGTSKPAAGAPPPAAGGTSKPAVTVVPPGQKAPSEVTSPRLKLANALNEGRITVGSDEEANRLVQSSSNVGATPAVDRTQSSFSVGATPAATTPPKAPPAATTPPKATPLSPRLKLANALNEGRIKVGDDEEANRLVQSASDGTTPLVADKKKETQVKRDRLLAKGRAMPSRTA